MITSHGFRDLRVYQLAFKLAMGSSLKQNTFQSRKNIPSRIKFDAPQGVLRQILARGIERSFTLKCLSVRWQMPMVRQPKLKYGWTLLRIAVTCRNNGRVSS